MGNFTSLSDLISKRTGAADGYAEDVWWHKDARVGAAAAVAPVANRYVSLWQYNGSPGSNGTTLPGAVAAPTNTTIGALHQLSNQGSASSQKWLTGCTAVCSAPGTLILYDRLLHISGLSGTVASPTAQTVGGTLTRYNTATSCLGNQIWVEIYTQIGVTGTTITASYQNQAGSTVTSQSTAIGNTGLREAQRIIPIPLNAGDSGVLGVSSITLAATTGTAGNFGITVARPIAMIQIATAGAAGVRDLVAGLPSLPEIKNNACLALAWFASSTTLPILTGSLHTVER